MQKVALGALYIALFVAPFSVSAATFTIGGVSFLQGTDTARVQVNSSEAVSQALFDFELYDANGNKVAQRSTTFGTQDGQALCNWDIAIGPGVYVVKYGVFSPDWSTLYAWNNRAATFLGPFTGKNTINCSNAQGSAPSFVTSATTQGFMPNGKGVFTTTVESTQDVSNVLVDTEVYEDGNSAKVDQWFSIVNLKANTPLSVVREGSMPSTPDFYNIKVGLFSPDWTKQYVWNDEAGIGKVADIKLSSSVVYYTVNGVQTLKTIINSNQNIPDAILDTEIYNTAGEKVAQNFVTQDLWANTTASLVWNLPTGTLPDGTYTFKVGIFTPEWKDLYDWNAHAGVVTTGAPFFTLDSVPDGSVTNNQQSLSENQIQSLLNLLQSFGADSSTISSFANVFTGHTPSPRKDATTQPISQSQTQAIINLLTSFGASATMLQNIEEVLSGQYVA